MDVINTIETEIAQLMSANKLYNTYHQQWRFLLESYIGGSEYTNAQHLSRYQLESEDEYNQRVRSTPLENHCKSIISVYNSFLFRECPDRKLVGIENMPETAAFIDDADLEGRCLDAFMKDVATWASVFGHCWIIMTKPNINATSRADEIAAGIRPYVNVVTPMVMLDWKWTRQANGYFELEYLKYIEDVNGDIHTVKEWRKESVRTVVLDQKSSKIYSDITEANQLGIIPAIICYNERSSVRGIGVSDISDIATHQKFIYNATSEIEQSIRLDSHPSLVITGDTQAGIGAGSLITMSDTLDPGLKPYLLDFKGANITQIYEAVKHSIEAIDKMANTGSTRSTISRSAQSGVAMMTEFQLLNAKLSTKADALELAEEQLWDLYCKYMGVTWTGCIEYPDNFDIKDKDNEIAQLKVASDAKPVDPRVRQAIDSKILDWLDLDEDEVATIKDPTILVPDSVQETGELPEE